MTFLFFSCFHFSTFFLLFFSLVKADASPWTFQTFFFSKLKHVWDFVTLIFSLGNYKSFVIVIINQIWTKFLFFFLKIIWSLIYKSWINCDIWSLEVYSKIMLLSFVSVIIYLIHSVEKIRRNYISSLITVFILEY